MDGSSILIAFLRAITDFGASGAVLPAICAVVAALWLMDEKRNATSFGLAAALCVAAVSLSKIGFMTCRSVASITSPSGHAALAAFFYPSLGLLMASMNRSLAARVFAGACLALVPLVAVSRFVVGGHTQAEAALGAVFGAACFGLFWRLSALRPRGLGVLAAALPVVLVVTYFTRHSVGLNFSEDRFFWIANWLRGQIGC